METQPELLKNRNRVPERTEHTGKLVGFKNRFRIVTASDMETAESAATTAGVTGSVGAEEYVCECAPPHVMPEQRKIERWAIVERADGMKAL